MKGLSPREAFILQCADGDVEQTSDDSSFAADERVALGLVARGLLVSRHMGDVNGDGTYWVYYDITTAGRLALSIHRALSVLD